MSTLCIWVWEAAWICPLWPLHVELNSAGQCSLKQLWSLPWVNSCFSVEAVVKSGTAEETSHHVWTSGCFSAAGVGQRLHLPLLAGSRSSDHLWNPQISGKSEPWCTFYFSIFLPVFLDFIFSSSFFNLRGHTKQPDHCRYLNFQKIQLIIFWWISSI